jgi:zinc protease
MTKEERRIFEDKVQLPRLYLTWHSAPSYTRDEAVLSVLGGILSSGKSSRLYKKMVYDEQIAQSAFANQNGSEIAGQFQIQVTAKPERNLTEMESAVDSVLGDVLKNGVTEEEVRKALTGIEVGVVNGAATALGRATTLAFYYSYTGDPGNINKQMDLYKGITPKEVQEVAQKYLSKPGVVLSIVPLGKNDLGAKKEEDKQ